MVSAIIEFLQGSPVLMRFLVLGFGYLLGNLSVAGMSLGPVGGVLIAGLFFGRFGFEMSAAAQTFGFTLFIFCVGYQAGPRFFDVLMSEGLKYLALALIVAITGFALAAGLGRALNLEPGANAGLLAGGMTTTPTLAAAQDAIRSGVDEDLAGHTLREIGMRRESGVMLISIHRQRTELPLEPDLVLKRGDVVSVRGPEANVEYLERWVGHVEREVDQTDLMTFAFGIAAGLAIGALSITVGRVSLGLGSAGGLLISGLVIGFLRASYPVFGRVPGAALWVFMELGLLMFMAGVGLNAGGDIVATLRTEGLRLVGAGVLVTAIPVLAGSAFGRKVLALNPAELMGGIAGSVTSGAALQIVTRAANSPAPAIGYTGAFANVIPTVAGSLILLF